MGLNYFVMLMIYNDTNNADNHLNIGPIYIIEAIFPVKVKL